MELSHIGKHCHLKGCGRLDFLPFKCAQCGGLFCIDHRFPESHECQPSSALMKDKADLKAPSQESSDTVVAKILRRLLADPSNARIRRLKLEKLGSRLTNESIAALRAHGFRDDREKGLLVLPSGIEGSIWATKLLKTLDAGDRARTSERARPKPEQERKSKSHRTPGSGKNPFRDPAQVDLRDATEKDVKRAAILLQSMKPKLARLRRMGYHDEMLNLRALHAAGGHINSAIHHIQRHHGKNKR